MANRARDNVARGNTKSTEKENTFLSYSSQSPSSRKSSTKENPLNDLIVLLAEAYENKRARQVTEWERGQNIPRLV